MNLPLLLMLLVPPTVSLQTHPCDVVPPTVYREPAAQLANLRVGFCFQPVDTNGVVITEVIGFTLQINSGPDIDLGHLTPSLGANAAGDFYYEFANNKLAAGVVTLKAYTTLLGMSAQSPPITLTLLGSPKSPHGTVIIRGPQP